MKAVYCLSIVLQRVWNGLYCWNERHREHVELDCVRSQPWNISRLHEKNDELLSLRCEGCTVQTAVLLWETHTNPRVTKQVWQEEGKTGSLLPELVFALKLKHTWHLKQNSGLDHRRCLYISWLTTTMTSINTRPRMNTEWTFCGHGNCQLRHLNAWNLAKGELSAASSFFGSYH